MLVWIMVFVIRFYQFAIRPFLAGSCSFFPTCSEYGIEALHRHGWCRGLVLTLRRVVRCHPLVRGGIDPVPDSIAPRGDA
ncbi:MAG: membrane protein insertion efficiency factor YidD [Planctomycetes bacterium]|nr:membrane protein insertion efficiency factor YidD [Planctomycetota bacterium]